MEQTMQDYPLTVQHVLWRVENLFRRKEIVTKRESGVHRYTYGDFAGRVHQLAHALEEIGVSPATASRRSAGTTTGTSNFTMPSPAWAPCCTRSICASSPSNSPS